MSLVDGLRSSHTPYGGSWTANCPPAPGRCATPIAPSTALARQDPFSFDPTRKLWLLLGNHKPEVGTGGFAFWRRMRLLPFERVVSDDRKIDNLADLLVMEEGPGILAWLIDGARRYLADRDLTGPERVRIATTAYAVTEDHTGRFYEECCRQAPDLRAEQTTLYSAYRTWCQNEGTQVISSRAFASRTRELVGLVSPKEMKVSNQRKYYPGIGLLTDEERDAGA